jgi:hypothetical protein
MHCQHGCCCRYCCCCCALGGPHKHVCECTLHAVCAHHLAVLWCCAHAWLRWLQLPTVVERAKRVLEAGCCVVIGLHSTGGGADQRQMASQPGEQDPGFQGLAWPVRNELLAFVGAMDQGGGDPQVAALRQRIKQADLAANVLVGGGTGSWPACCCCCMCFCCSCLPQVPAWLKCTCTLGCTYCTQLSHQRCTCCMPAHPTSAAVASSPARQRSEQLHTCPPAASGTGTASTPRATPPASSYGSATPPRTAPSSWPSSAMQASPTCRCRCAAPGCQMTVMASARAHHDGGQLGGGRTVQQLGRTHRSNQLQPPQYVVVVSDVVGEHRWAGS